MTLAIPIFKKTSRERLDFGFNYSKELSFLEDEILESQWTIPSDLTHSGEIIIDHFTKIFLSGGTAGQTYKIINEITTAGGRTYEKSFNLFIDTP